MEYSSGIKFGDLQKDKRYKWLEQNLRLSLFKQTQNNSTDNKNYLFSSQRCSSLSTIDPDSSCSNVGNPHLQDSKVESEIVSSSHNLRKLLLIQNSNLKPLATSSIKNYSTKSVVKDNAMMLPPSINNLNHHKRQVNYNSPQPESQNNLHESDNESNIASSTSSVYQESNNFSVSDCRDSLCVNKVFYRWRVLLNDEEKLILKGTLEGKIVRSKPILKRLSHNKIQSIYKQIYILNGDICDDSKELPEYVYRKFYNGFPHDWENVYQLWKNFVSGGSKVTFRWPTSITDDDDDLQSEITHYALTQRKMLEPENYSNNTSSLGYHSKSLSDSNQNLEISEKKKNIDAQPTSLILKKKDVNSENIPNLKDSSTCNYNMENNTKTTHNKNGNSSNSSFQILNFDLKEIIHEDKLRLILSNLADKTCPSENVQKFLEVSNFLRYIVLFKPANNFEINDRKSPDCNNHVCQNCNNTASDVEEQFKKVQNMNGSSKSIKYSIPKDLDLLKQIQEEKSLKTLDSENFKAVDSSDSDTCMGIAHAPLEHLLKPRSHKDQRFKDKKKKDKKSVNINKQIKTQDSFDKNQTSRHYDLTVSTESDSVKESTKINSNKKRYVKKEQKPIIKSNEEVYDELNQKYLPKTLKSLKSQVLIDERDVKEQSYYDDFINNKKTIGQEKMNKDLFKHPFLNYDSEDYPEDDFTSDQVDNQLKHKQEIQEQQLERVLKALTKNEPFGTKENPYLLLSWVPCVLYDESRQQCFLTFEGKLLNKAGHINDRKHITDIVCKRHSTKLVETVKNEFFFLEGDLNDPKHAVPQQLIKLCLTGCPSKIDEFCEEWKDLKSGILPRVVTTSLKSMTINQHYQGQEEVNKKNGILQSVKVEDDSDGQPKSDRKRVAQTLNYSSSSEDESRKKIKHRQSKSNKKPASYSDEYRFSQIRSELPLEPSTSKLQKKQRVDKNQIPEEMSGRRKMRPRSDVKYI